MLVEIPMHSKINEVKSIFFELISNGIVPILAHPERYEAYYKDYEFFLYVKKYGSFNANQLCFFNWIIRSSC